MFVAMELYACIDNTLSFYLLFLFLFFNIVSLEHRKCVDGIGDDLDEGEILFKFVCFFLNSNWLYTTQSQPIHLAYILRHTSQDELAGYSQLILKSPAGGIESVKNGFGKVASKNDLFEFSRREVAPVHETEITHIKLENLEKN